MYNIPYHGDRDLSGLNFLITGGAGFIGSNLAAYLLKYGAGKVRILDNFSSGSACNLNDFSLYPSFELIDGDAANLDDCNKAVKGIDIILHEASLTPPNEADIKGLNLLIAANVAGVKRIVDSGSSFIYGNGYAKPVLEEENLNTFSSYVVSKYVNELYADIISGLYGTEYIGLRYFNVFGPGLNQNTGIIPQLISSLMSHKQPEIQSSYKNSRIFTYIENVVQANIIAALSDKSIPLSQIYNVTFGDQTSVNELAGTLKDILALIDPDIKEIDIDTAPSATEGTTGISYSVAKAENLQGFYPYFNLKDGLMETVKFYLEDEKSSRILN